MSRSLKELIENNPVTEKAKVRRFWNASSTVIYGNNGTEVERLFIEKIESWIKNWKDPEQAPLIKAELDRFKDLLLKDFEGLTIPNGIDKSDLAVGYIFNIYSRTRPAFLDIDKKSFEASQYIKNNNEIAIYFQKGEDGLKNLHEKEMLTNENTAKDAIKIAKAERVTYQYFPTSKENTHERNVLFAANNLLNILNELKNPVQQANHEKNIQKLGENLEILSKHMKKLDPEIKKSLKEFFDSPKGKEHYNNAKAIIGESQKNILKETKSEIVDNSILRALKKIIQKIRSIPSAQKTREKKDESSLVSTKRVEPDKNIKELADFYVEIGKIPLEKHTKESLIGILIRLEDSPLIDKEKIGSWKNSNFPLQTFAEIRKELERIGVEKAGKDNFDIILRAAYKPEKDQPTTAKTSESLNDKPKIKLPEWAQKALAPLQAAKARVQEKIDSIKASTGPSKKA